VEEGPAEGSNGSERDAHSQRLHTRDKATGGERQRSSNQQRGTCAAVAGGSAVSAWRPEPSPKGAPPGGVRRRRSACGLRDPFAPERGRPQEKGAVKECEEMAGPWRRGSKRGQDRAKSEVSREGADRVFEKRQLRGEVAG